MVNSTKVNQKFQQKELLDGVLNVLFSIAKIRSDTKPLTKKISLDADGKLVKTPAANMSSGQAETIETDLKGLAGIIHGLGKNQALCHGVCGHDQVRILAQYKHKNQQGTITRTKTFFLYPNGPALAMIDYDPDEGQQELSVQEVISRIDSVCPGFADIQKLLTSSTSACISTTDGREITGQGSGFHLYFVVESGQDIERFKTALFQRLWLAGHGYIKISKAGSLLKRTIFDDAVMSPERLDFVSGAILGEGLVQNRPEPVYIEGNGTLDTGTCKSLDDPEMAQYQSIVNAAKAAVEIQAQAIHEEYVKTEAPELVKRHKHLCRELTADQAEKILRARGRGQHVDLFGNDVLIFDDLGVVLVSDVLADPGKYDGITLSDPVEADKGPCKARFDANIERGAGKPVIHSFVHGGVVYFLHAEDAGNPTIEGAIKILDSALIDQADDPGALYSDDCLDAYNFLKKKSVQGYIRYREKISACKNLQITKFEQATKRRKNLKRFGDDGKPDHVMQSFNSLFFGSMIGSQFRIVEQIKDKKGQPDIRIMTVPDFHNRHANSFLPDPSDPARVVQASRFWMENDKRRDFMGGIEFDPKPNRCRPDTFNMFQGFAVTPKAGSWDLLRRHVYDVLVSGNKAHGDYLLAWCAKILQKPWEKNITCPVLVSGQGSGKNTFIEAFGKILGQHFKTVTNDKGLTGRFNSHMKDCLLLFANEAIWGGDRQAAGQVKGIITDPTIRVEFKGKDSFEVDNYINLIVASNSDRAVPAEIGDRRFFCLDVSDHRKDDADYFNALHAEIDNGGIEALMTDLLNMDLSGVNLRKIERTNGLLNQILENMDSVNLYWFHRLKDGYLMPAIFDENGHESRAAYPWDKPILCTVQFNDYLDYCHQNQKKYPKNQTSFGSFFKIYDEIMERQTRLTIDGTRGKSRAFGSLEKCRTIYADKILSMEVLEVFND